MSEQVLRYERQLAAAQQQLQQARELPERDVFQPGDVIRWKRPGGDYRSAIKVTRFWSLGDNRACEWDVLLRAMRDHEGPIEIASGWQDITNKPKPSVELEETGGRYVLFDRATNTQWERNGDEWEKTS